jgi:hypothetical protein
MTDETRRDLFDDELSRALGSRTDAVPQELNRRIQGRLIANLRPVIPIPPPGICFAGIFGLLAILAGALILITRTGAGKISDVQTAAMALLFVTGGVLFTFLLTRQFAPSLPQPIGTRLALSIFGFLVIAGTVALFPWREPGTAWNVSWQCLIRVIEFAALTAVILTVPMRRAAMLSASGRGAVVGAAAGLTGVAIQQFSCAYQQASHLLLWHWSGIAIAAAAGAVIGSMTRRISSRHA